MRLADVCEVNPTAGRKLDRGQLCSFVPMEAVDEWSGSIVRRETRRVAEVSSGYTPFQDGDVLVAKITPCMENGKCALARNLVNGIGYGSTEFHVLRAGPEVLPEWLYYFWRLPQTRDDAERSMRGSAGQKRVPEEFFDQVQISLPPLPLQRRIATILDQTDRLRRMRRYALELSDSFLPALFLRMFGDPAMNSKGWPVAPAGKHFDIKLGKMLDKKRHTGQHLKPYLGNANVQWGRFALAEVKQMDFPPNDFERFRLRVGDIMVCEGGEVGRTAIWQGEIPDCCCQKAVHRLRRKTDQVLPDYFLWYMWGAVTSGLVARETATSTIGHFTAERFEVFRVMLPPVERQDEFAGVVRKHSQYAAGLRESLRQAEHMFQSLLKRYFGEGG